MLYTEVLQGLTTTTQRFPGFKFQSNRPFESTNSSPRPDTHALPLWPIRPSLRIRQNNDGSPKEDRVPRSAVVGESAVNWISMGLVNLTLYWTLGAQTVPGSMGCQESHSRE
jgi:hypothetical protein